MGPCSKQAFRFIKSFPLNTVFKDSIWIDSVSVKQAY